MSQQQQDLRLSARELMERYIQRKNGKSHYSYKALKNTFQRLKVDPFVLAEEAITKPLKVETFLFEWMEKYYSAHERAARTIRHSIGAVEKSLRYCGAKDIRWEILHDEAFSFPLPKDREVTKEEIRKIHVTKRLKFLNTLLYSSGIRDGAFFYQVRPSMRWDFLSREGFRSLDYRWNHNRQAHGLQRRP